MRRSKKIFACLLICIGILILPFSFIKGLSSAFLAAAGSALITWGIVSFLFEHFVYKIGRAKIMDEDERNILISGKANTLTSEFTNIGLIILALYSAIHRSDRMGFIIATIIFLLSHMVYVLSFKYFDRHHI